MTEAAGAWRDEVWRKVVHLSMVWVPACILWAPPPWTWRGPLLALIGFLAADFARLRWRSIGRLVDARIGGSLRPNERRGWIWPVHYLTASATLLAWIAPPAVAATAVAYLVLGDAAAALVGRRLGRHRWGCKSLEGSLACLAVCLGVGAVTLPGRPLAIGMGALVATLVEVLPLRLDDNWTMPLASAVALALLV